MEKRRIGRLVLALIIIGGFLPVAGCFIWNSDVSYGEKGAPLSSGTLKQIKCGETTKDWLLYFAPGGALARMEYVGEGMGGGPARLVETYGEWMPVGNIKYPHAETTLMDDKPVLEAKLTNLNLNPELADELFKKPGQ